MTRRPAFALAIPFVLASLAIGGFAGCGTTIALQGSDQIPAAGGSVNIKTGDNGNTMLTIEVKHLAPPDRVEADAKNYVVWARPFEEGASATNVGTLALDADLTGKLETLTPLRSFDVFLTAESEPAAQSPSGKQLLSARVVQK